MQEEVTLELHFLCYHYIIIVNVITIIAVGSISYFWTIALVYK